MRLKTKVDQVARHTGDAPLRVCSAVQSLRLVKNFVDVLYGSGVFQLAYLPQGEEVMCV